MNIQYGYNHMEDWETEMRLTQAVPIEILVKKLCETPEKRGDIDMLPEWQENLESVKKLPAYHYKAGCLDDPETVSRLDKAGLHYESLEMGATRWLVITPKEALEKRDRKLPLLLVFHKEDYADPFWAMKTLKFFGDYQKAVAQKKDRTIIYIVSDYGREVNMFTGMITEGLQNYCGDREKIYVDISNLLQNGICLNDIEGFEYKNPKGETTDPDSSIEWFEGTPVLNFSRNWTVPWKAHAIDAAGDGTVDRKWLIHSETGRKLMEANRFALRYMSPEEPEVQKYWQHIGLEYKQHFIYGERWVMFKPVQSSVEKLPVVICLHEVNEPDDHSVIAAYANYEAYCNLAAQGECMVLFFAMENPAWNDWICEILKMAELLYPVDRTRVYITGHSHNGHFAQEFARRHPDIIACVAPLGNSPGLPTPAVSHEAVPVDDEKAKLMESMDMPTCILCGCKEVGGMVPINKTAYAFESGINVEGYAASAEGKIEMWNRRLKAERCPQQTKEEILAARESPNKATRMLGVPSEQAKTIYLDGFEHYIADFKNREGKYHFRIVAIENMPHMIVPSMHLCAWNYMRRFARDQETGDIIELV